MAPCTAISFTQWFTRSAPTVWCSPNSKATFSLVPTPSAELTRIGILPSLQVEPEERAKPANPSQHVAIKGLLRQELDALLGAVASAEVDACVGISHGFGCGFVGHGEGFLLRKLLRHG